MTRPIVSSRTESEASASFMAFLGSLSCRYIPRMRPDIREPMKSLDFPAFSVFAAEIGVGFGDVGHREIRGVPFELFISGAMGDIPQIDGFGERGGIGEVAGRGRAFLAGFDPLLVMANGFCDAGSGRGGVLKLLLGKQEQPAVVGEEHS